MAIGVNYQPGDIAYRRIGGNATGTPGTQIVRGNGNRIYFIVTLSEPFNITVPSDSIDVCVVIDGNNCPIANLNPVNAVARLMYEQLGPLIFLPIVLVSLGGTTIPVNCIEGQVTVKGLDQ